MGIPFCLAMTAAEFPSCQRMPASVGWMACHFSLSGAGLSNLPSDLPAGSVLLIDDSIPFSGHDAKVILGQLLEILHSFSLQAILLDFQRPAIPETIHMAEFLCRQLPCPVIVTPEYADSASSVLLPPCPLNRPLGQHIAPFKTKNIWLEISLEGLIMQITGSGCFSESVPHASSVSFPHWDKQLLSHYRIALSENTAVFHLQRTGEDLKTLLDMAESLGVSHAIGFCQEWQAMQ